jgi:hypothetical protein
MDSVNGIETGLGTGDDFGTEPATKRARGRDSLFLVARMRIDGESAVRDVRVRNLSEGGLMVELDRIVAVGTVVHLELRGIGDIRGAVAWCTEGRLGIALDGTIDPKKARKPVGVAKSAATPFRAKVTPR